VYPVTHFSSISFPSLPNAQKINNKAVVMGIEQDVEASRHLRKSTAATTHDRRLLFQRHRQQDLSGLGYAVMD
jgi:hypothetical protein